IRPRSATGGRTFLGAAGGIPAAQSGRRNPGAGAGRPAGGAQRRHHRRISARDACRRIRADAGGAPATGRGAAPHRLVQRQIPHRSERPAGDGARLQAPHDARTRRRPAGHRRAARRALQYPLSFGLYRLAGGNARLAGRRAPELRRSGGGRSSFVGRLPGRSAVDRKRSSEELVRAGEVASVVSSDPGRHTGRAAAGETLRQPGFLSGADIKTALAAQARARGFDAFGITRPDAAPEAKARLERFLAEGAHGDMAWMATTAERRASPLALWPDVRSVVMLGMNYGPGDDPLAILKQRDRAAISTYAKGEDYHELIKSRLKEIARWLTANAGGDVKVFVDTAAVMEKPLAEKAGLGWQGKHTNLVSRQFGSWLFLGSIFNTLDLPADVPGSDTCGSCRACLDICPTAAFPEPYRLDARRCISYLTIEHKTQIPRDLRPLIGNRIFGCDDCLAVCPWNKFAAQGREAKLAAREELRAPMLADLARLDDAAFRKLFAKTSVKRVGRDRFVRNVVIAIGNSGDVSLAGEAERLLEDASPLVRGAAVWALSRLVPRQKLAAMPQRLAERDEDVRDEWVQAIP